MQDLIFFLFFFLISVLVWTFVSQALRALYCHPKPPFTPTPMPCGAAALGFARIASTHPSSFTLKEQTNRASRSPPALILHCCRQRHQACCYGCLICNYFSFSPKTEAFSHQLLCCVTYKCAPLNTYGHRNWALPIKQFKDIL